MNRFFVMLTLLACGALALAGCGKGAHLSTESVTGTVTLDGSPLADCNVFFQPKGDGAQAVGRTDAQGVYKLQTALGAADAGTTPGDYAVFFTCDTVVSEAETDEDGNLKKDEVVKSAIPAKYNSADTSGFTATVQKGKNTFDFDLQSK